MFPPDSAGAFGPRPFPSRALGSAGKQCPIARLFLRSPETSIAKHSLVALKQPRTDLQMCKKLLRKSQMSNSDVLRARGFADDLVRWEVRGPGDVANAMRRLTTRYALPFAKQWALRYRPPKEVASTLLARIEAAHAAEKRRQLGMLAHDTEVTATVAGADDPAVRASVALLGAAVEADPSARAVVASAVLGARGRRAGHAPEDLSDLPLWRGVTEE